jgi:hypothetical protein
MLLKRIYKKQDLERFKMELEESIKVWKAKLEQIGVPLDLADKFAKQIGTQLVNPPDIEGVDVEHTGTNAEQNFSTTLVIDFLKKGIIEIAEEILILHSGQEDLRYKIKRRPGRYCLHCGEKLPDDEKGELARLHIVEKHLGLKSPDPYNPSGYVALNHFECLLDSDQHNKLKFHKEVING